MVAIDPRSIVRCESCGKEVYAGAPTCPHCGVSRLDKGEEPPPPDDDRHGIGAVDPEKPLPFHEFQRAYAEGRVHMIIHFGALKGRRLRLLIPRYHMWETMARGILIPCFLVLLAQAMVSVDEGVLTVTGDTPKERYQVLFVFVIFIPLLLSRWLRRRYFRRRILRDENTYRLALETGAITITRYRPFGPLPVPPTIP